LTLVDPGGEQVEFFDDVKRRLARRLGDEI